MLAPEGEQEGAEPLSEGEGHGSGEEPGETAAKNPPAYGERDVVKADDGTGEISFGQQATTAVTTGTNLYGTGSMLRTDVTAILLPSDTSWWEGAEADEPWQWFTEGARFSLEPSTFGDSSSKNAILAVDTGGGKYLWMFTYIQPIERGSR